MLIALASGLGQPLAVAVLRPAGVRTDPAPAAAPAAATAFRAPVTARAGAPEKPGEPVRVRVGAVDGDSLVMPILSYRPFNTNLPPTTPMEPTIADGSAKMWSPALAR